MHAIVNAGSISSCSFAAAAGIRGWLVVEEVAGIIAVPGPRPWHEGRGPFLWLACGAPLLRRIGSRSCANQRGADV